jgi:hypothetical protein
VGRIAELCGIEILEDRALSQPDGNQEPGMVVRIGAMTTSAEIEYSPSIARYTPLLAEAATVISDSSSATGPRWAARSQRLTRRATGHPWSLPPERRCICAAAMAKSGARR